MTQSELRRDLAHKFPRTPHLYDLGGSAVTRDDLLLGRDDEALFLSARVSIEEKLDGANLGVSIGADGAVWFQNRAHFVTAASAVQFRALDAWLAEHRFELFDLLRPERDILFGEWLYARHSVAYDRIPAYFLAFDLYDAETGHFLSRRSRDACLARTTIPVAPLVFEGVLGSKKRLLELLDRTSAFGTGPIEGLYLRVDEQPGLQLRGAGASRETREREETAGGFLLRRAKVVRCDFLQGIEDHWSKRKLVKNGLRPDLT